MADAGETTRKPRSEPARAKSAGADVRAARQPHTARNRFLILLLLLVSVLSASAYLLLQLGMMQGRLDEFASENAGLGETVAAQAAAIETLQQRLAETREADPALLLELEQRFSQETESLRRRLGEIGTAQSGMGAEPVFGWKIREAAYLLSLANRKLQLEADVPGALALFESADLALVQSRREDLLRIRQSIAEEIAQLRALPTPDQESVYFRLESFEAEIAQLDIPLSLREAAAAADTATDEPTPPASGFLAAGLEFLGGVFVWRKWDERPEFELLAGQEAFIRESIRLQIDQAQLALLLRDSALYRASLQSGLDQLRRFAGSGELMTELNELLRIDIAPEMPALNQSLNLVGEYLAEIPQ